MKPILPILALCLLLAGCGEEPRTIETSLATVYVMDKDSLINVSGWFRVVPGPLRSDSLYCFTLIWPATDTTCRRLEPRKETP